MKIETNPYVPYTGATGAVDLGANKLTVGAEIDVSAGDGIYFYTGATYEGNIYTSGGTLYLYNEGNLFSLGSSLTAYEAILDTSGINTANKTFTFPNASGTLALGTGTINEIAYWAGANTLGALAVATYPSLAELAYVKGVTSAIQTQIGTKAPTASPTFTGTVTIPTPFTLGAISVTATGTELNYVGGVTSAIQTQLNGKQSSDATLTSIATLGTAADKLAYTTGIDTWAEASLTAFGRSLIDDADAATARTTLGLPIGFSSKARAYRATSVQSIPDATATKVQLNAEDYDGLGEMDTSVKSGTASATLANHLVDTVLSPFVAGDVGRTVWNTTDNTYATITTYNSTSDVTLSADIFVATEGYSAYFSRFTAQAAGYYLVCGMVEYAVLADSLLYQADIRKNGTSVAVNCQRASGVAYQSVEVTDIIYLAVDDYLELWTYQASGASQDLEPGSNIIFMAIHRIS